MLLDRTICAKVNAHLKVAFETLAPSTSLFTYDMAEKIASKAGIEEFFRVFFSRLAQTGLSPLSFRTLFSPKVLNTLNFIYTCWQLTTNYNNCFSEFIKCNLKTTSKSLALAGQSINKTKNKKLGMLQNEL